MSADPREVSHAPHLVQGMERDLVVADWAVLTNEEVFDVLSQLRVDESRVALASEDVPAQITWWSPRPMSAAALVRWRRGDYFVKRHHVSVRDAPRLRVEHAFARHLRQRGQPVARVLEGADGDTVVSRGDFNYEVHEKVAGIDLYRQHPSWYPFTSRRHAYSAGASLAHFLAAAENFSAPATPPGVLTNSQLVITSADPLASLDGLVTSRPALARALEDRDFDQDVHRYLLPAIAAAAPSLRPVASQWGHGDWHASNLTWTTSGPDARVAGVFDLGLANRTSAVHDLAVALERSVVDWLDVRDAGEVRADLDAVDALLDGFESVRPLRGEEWTALRALLPIVHLEFALSEVEYFADVVTSEENTTLAYEGYLVGHTRWFDSPRGGELLDHLERRWAFAG